MGGWQLKCLSYNNHYYGYIDLLDIAKFESWYVLVLWATESQFKNLPDKMGRDIHSALEHTIVMRVMEGR